MKWFQHISQMLNYFDLSLIPYLATACIYGYFNNHISWWNNFYKFLEFRWATDRYYCNWNNPPQDIFNKINTRYLTIFNIESVGSIRIFEWKHFTSRFVEIFLIPNFITLLSNCDLLIASNREFYNKPYLKFYSYWFLHETCFNEISIFISLSSCNLSRKIILNF